MATPNEYEPDYTVPPGWVIAERLAAHDIPQSELARRCGRSAKLISEIIAGEDTHRTHNCYRVREGPWG